VKVIEANQLVRSSAFTRLPPKGGTPNALETLINPDVARFRTLTALRPDKIGY